MEKKIMLNMVNGKVEGVGTDQLKINEIAKMTCYFAKTKDQQTSHQHHSQNKGAVALEIAAE